MDRLTQLLGFHATDPSNLLLTLDVLDAHLLQGAYVEALAFSGALDPTLAHASAVRLRMGRCAMSCGQAETAVGYFSAIVAEGEASPLVHHDLAYALFSLGRLDEAESALAPAVTLSADVPEIGLLHGRMRYQRGDFAAAELIVGVVTEAHPGRADAWGLAALIALDQGKPDDALGAAERALSLDPADKAGQMAKGGLALAALNGDVALSCFAPVVEAEAQNGRAAGGLGEAYLIKGDLVAARGALERSTQLQPGHLGTWHALAWCQLLQSDVDGADVSFRSALDADRNFAESHGGLAIVYALQGKRELADQALRRAQRLDADGGNARFARSLLLASDGNEIEANQLLQTILHERVPGVALPAATTITQLRALMMASRTT